MYIYIISQSAELLFLTYIIEKKLNKHKHVTPFYYKLADIRPYRNPQSNLEQIISGKRDSSYNFITNDSILLVQNSSSMPILSTTNPTKNILKNYFKTWYNIIKLRIINTFRSPNNKVTNIFL